MKAALPVFILFAVLNVFVLGQHGDEGHEPAAASKLA